MKLYNEWTGQGMQGEVLKSGPSEPVVDRVTSAAIGTRRAFSTLPLCAGDLKGSIPC